MVGYNSSDAHSWRRAYELLVQVAAHQEITGLEVPCLLIAAKDDLESDPSCTKGSTRVHFVLPCISCVHFFILYFLNPLAMTSHIHHT